MQFLWTCGNLSSTNGQRTNRFGAQGLAFLCGCLTLAPGLALGQAGSDDLAAKLTAIEKQVEAKRIASHVPGLALAIVKDDKVIFIKGFGMRDLEGKLPVTADTLFAIGSCTKAFTSMAATIAQERGKLSLHDSPKKYLPYFKLEDLDLEGRVTLADMLSHRTGLMAYNDFPWATSVLRRDQVIRSLADAKPTAKLGEKFQYNNIMFLAAGECVAAAMQMSYEDLIRNLIFQPLGMNLSNLTKRDMLRASDHATGYDITDPLKPALRLDMRDIANIAPAGAINSSASDMARWVRLMLNGGALDGARLVSEQGFKDLVTAHIEAGPNRSYGYGWVLDSWKGHREIWHNGGIDGFNSHLAMLPDDHLGFILLTNVSSSDLPQEAVDAVFSHLVQIPKASLDSAPKDPDQAAEAGIYRIGDPTKGPSLDISVTYKEGHLYAQPTGQANFPLNLIGDHRYTIPPPAPPKIFVSFRPSKTDSTRPELVLEQAGATLVGAPVTLAPIISYQAPITVEELMSRRVEADGGEIALRSHQTLQMAFSLHMENQGVTGEMQQAWRLPDVSSTLEQLQAAGRRIGTIHEYFDGKSGRVESTYSIPDFQTGTRLTDARLASNFCSDLDWKKLFKTVSIEKSDKVSGEDVYVVRKTVEGGSPIIDYVSTGTFRLLRRDSSGGRIETFKDYRKVGDLVLPFEIDIDDASGHTVLKLLRTVLDRRLGDELFRPGYRRCRTK